MTFSSISSSSWSNLPLDLLLSIKKKLQLYQRFDLTSFRSVCSHWCSAMPAPNPLPRYEVIFNKKDKIIQFIIDNNTSNTASNLSINLPLSSSSPISFFCSSNGWLVFKTRNNGEIIHLFDPVSSQKRTFPSLSPNLLLHHNKFKTCLRNTSRLHLSKVIVSSNANGSVAVAGIVQITGRTEFNGVDRRFVFCRHGQGQKWNLLMEKSKGIIDIALDGNDRFYAIGEDWELYMLDESPPLMMRLKKFKLWLPKQILEPDPEIDSMDERLSIRCCGMEGIGGSDLKIYGCCDRFRFKGSWISLKLEVPKLYGGNKKMINVACEAEWCLLDPSPYYGIQYFTPSLYNY